MAKTHTLTWPNNKAFPRLDADWFRARGVGDPDGVFEGWRWFERKKPAPTDQMKFKHALELAVGVGDGAVRHWITKESDPESNRADQLSPRTLKDLDAAAKALGWDLRNPVTEDVVDENGGVKRIVLLAQLTDVPSPRYHLSVLESIVRSCDDANLSVALHEVSQSDRNMAASVERVVRSSFPHGVILFRLTPTKKVLDALRVYSTHLPCVLVHASRLRYPSPFIAHIVPAQGPIRGAVAEWVRGLKPNGSRTVVVAAMSPEKLKPAFPKMSASVPASIREERQQLVLQGIRDAGFEGVVEQVGDYGAHSAQPIAKKHPRALGFVCFSDEIAVGLYQLQKAAGRDVRGRVLGFDGSDLAKAHKLASLDQKLADVGERVVEVFLKEFRRPPNTPPPPCQEISVELGLRV